MTRGKKILLGVVVVVVLLAGAMAAFIYKVTVGWPIYESSPPSLAIAADRPNVLVFSKTNGFRHGDGIAAAEALFSEFGEAEGWNVIFTENGAVHDPEILASVDVLVWNNVTGRVLLDAQRDAMRRYIENGGSFIGLHGAGDFSHGWPWYEENLIGALFSHHSLDPQLQEGTVYPEGGDPSSTDSWVTMEEWYVFYDSPRKSNVEVLWNLEESDINPSGNLSFLVTDKDWGMGEDHPMVWRNHVGAGKTWYSAFGHDATNYRVAEYQNILKEGIHWSLN